MDENTLKILLVVVGALTGLISGVVLAALGFRHARSMERDRRQYEAETRWLGNRRDLYARFLASAVAYRTAVENRVAWYGRRESLTGAPSVHRDPMDVAYQEARLIAPTQVASALGNYYTRVGGFESFLAGMIQADAETETMIRSVASDEAEAADMTKKLLSSKESANSLAKSWSDLQRSLWENEATFLAAAREDLGVKD